MQPELALLERLHASFDLCAQMTWRCCRQTCLQIKALAVRSHQTGDSLMNTKVVLRPWCLRVFPGA
jgi:hypothetical protein